MVERRKNGRDAPRGKMHHHSECIWGTIHGRHGHSLYPSREGAAQMHLRPAPQLIASKNGRWQRFYLMILTC